MNRATFATFALLALAPLASPAQVLVETIPERAARCNEMAAVLPAVEAKAADYAARAPQVIRVIQAAGPGFDSSMPGPTFVGEGARLAREVEPLAKGCAVAAPEVGNRAAALVDKIHATRALVMQAGIEKTEGELRAKGLLP